MKKVVVSMSFIISMMMTVGLVAQNNDKMGLKPTVDSIKQEKPDIIDFNKWKNPVGQFIGVWSLEKTIVDAEGKENKTYPGTFMVVHPDASYTIFVNTDKGAVITSEGNILINSSDEYIEVISQHVNKSLVGLSNRIDYKIGPIYLHKSFWVEKDKRGGDYENQVNETWLRAKMYVGGFDKGIDLPI